MIEEIQARVHNGFTSDVPLGQNQGKAQELQWGQNEIETQVPLQGRKTQGLWWGQNKGEFEELQWGSEKLKS